MKLLSPVLPRSTAGSLLSMLCFPTMIIYVRKIILRLILPLIFLNLSQSLRLISVWSLEIFWKMLILNVSLWKNIRNSYSSKLSRLHLGLMFWWSRILMNMKSKKMPVDSFLPATKTALVLGWNLSLPFVKNTMVICPFRLTTIVLKSRCFYNVNSID